MLLSRVIDSLSEAAAFSLDGMTELKGGTFVPVFEVPAKEFLPRACFPDPLPLPGSSPSLLGAFINPMQ